METNEIIVHHATENNLKNVSIRIPKHQITVFTGVSGSRGKSSLVLDTLAAQSRTGKFKMILSRVLCSNIFQNTGDRM